MSNRFLVTSLAACACAAGLRLPFQVSAQQPPPLARSTSADLNGFLATTLVFTAADANKDGAVTREELIALAESWFVAADSAKAGSVTREQLEPALNTAMPMSGLAGAFNMGGRGGQPQTPEPASVAAMMAGLPASAPAKPARARKVLVLARAGGFVHSSIPLAAATIEALGAKTGAWSTTITYDAADITAENLRQYDAIFLASTTGAFLDDPQDPAATAARRQALLDFVRGGKGLAGIHAATDSYHQGSGPPAGAGGRGAGNPMASFSVGRTLAPVMVSQGC